MEILKGIPVSGGVVISTAYVLGHQRFVIPAESVSRRDTEREIERLHKAIEAASAEMESLKARLVGTSAERYSGILDAHRAMLTDAKLLDEISRRIREEGYIAEHAVTRVLSEYAQALEAVNDPYIRERSIDIRDIESRLLWALTGGAAGHGRAFASLDSPVAIIAHDMTPSDILSIDREKVTGFATDAGGSTSHTAIVAKALSIPAVVGLGRATSAVAGGDVVIIDGTHGLLVVNPDDATLARYRASLEAARHIEVGFLRDLPAETTDGRRVRLMGNIELPEEIPTALANGAEGIGLFRTEFLFLRSDLEPTEEEQYQAYVRAARELNGRPLVVRTLDLGGDKFAASIRHFSERNPSLGCRSIRFCLENPQLFSTQLRAILRAAVEGNIKLLFPMISTVEEVRQARAIVEEVREGLAARGIAMPKRIETGIMVEVPSVAVAADVFAREADFFSIGTNDLIQYTLAAERVNEHVAWLFTPAHPAILRLIKNVVEVASQFNIPVSLCGEMSSDPVFTPFLVGIGLEELSVSPPSLPMIKETVRSLSFSDARRIADEALEFHTSSQVTSFLLKSMPDSIRRLTS